MFILISWLRVSQSLLPLSGVAAMNRAAKAALINFQAGPIHLRTAIFHSTPVLDCRRRTYWDSRGGANRDSSKGGGPNRDSSKSWQCDHNEHDPSLSQGSGWFRQEYRAKGPKGGWTGNKGSQSGYRRGFQFCKDDDEDEDEDETIFQSAFDGHFYWSFADYEFPHWRSSSDHSSNYRTSRKDSATDASDRLALGLPADGPLTMGDVKNAYRESALKWHPDRHRGSSKADAEAEFKVCNAAYESLCDKFGRQTRKKKYEKKV